MVKHLVTRSNLGAWMVKCNPAVWKLHEFIADGNDWISGWSLHEGYRSDLMEPGDKIIMWVTLSPNLDRGIWGLGHITDYAGNRVFAVGDDDDPGYWLDETARVADDYGVDTDIWLFDKPVTDADLQAAGVHDLEVHRSPPLGNPLWVSKTELARLKPSLPEWPDYDEQELEVTAGYPLRDFYVAEAGVEAVWAWYEAEGWSVEDVNDAKLGWDLTCTHPDGRATRVAANGQSGERPVVFLTTNKYRAASEEDAWQLTVVTRALTDPLLHDFTGPEAVAAGMPYAYRADLSALKHDLPT